MDWLGAMNKAVEYIEDNINDKLDIEKVSKIALSSPFHFQRMYHIMTGVTIAEYIRRRRLTLAAQDIISGEKIIDVAFKYGYETPEAFTKAFGKLHGISPSAAKEPGAKLKAYPRLSFQISIKGDKKMDYTIIEKESFSVMGKKTKITMVDGQNFSLVPKFWDECMKDGTYQWACSNAGKLGIMGICLDFVKDTEEFYYMIGVENNCEELPKGYVSATIPKATWAVFEAVGPLPEAAQDVTRKIFAEWFPSTGYQHDCAPELEVYPEGDYNSPDYRCEIWIPIKK
ncbi:AraC family transcriptional regulator [Pseudobacteroides cellulosolvens]|uniref:Transcriptional activator, AraC family n=1 Tax=Pseudobacteroides cellulosolvens ATCC 35603 = DSM 2933 TaxID=398512 RepID=A0A0L6JP98_9FIRM|nr:AraC family transcriptional regulator [Pseudobacteroides cellulosolvens]KNY27187.1 transcriptional activator, AraC family [Pseudobacteroides cellulosolvens ATCC 35603 = DSM 2933]